MCLMGVSLRHTISELPKIIKPPFENTFTYRHYLVRKTELRTTPGRLAGTSETAHRVSFIEFCITATCLVEIPLGLVLDGE